MKNDLVNKGYLKRRINTLQDEARSMRFKIFECREANKKTQEQFFSTELKTIENEIKKCNMELDK
jgi:hypothetical protein